MKIWVLLAILANLNSGNIEGMKMAGFETEADCRSFAAYIVANSDQSLYKVGATCYEVEVLPHQDAS